MFDQESALNDVDTDRHIRASLLAILYTARRADAEKPGLGEVDLERLLGCPETHMRFHIWYLKENGLIHRMDNGMLAITASGVDVVLNGGGPVRRGVQLLDSGEEPANAARAQAEGGEDEGGRSLSHDGWSELLTVHPGKGPRECIGLLDGLPATSSRWGSTSASKLVDSA